MALELPYQPRENTERSTTLKSREKMIVSQADSDRNDIRSARVLSVLGCDFNQTVSDGKFVHPG